MAMPFADSSHTPPPQRRARSITLSLGDNVIVGTASVNTAIPFVSVAAMGCTPSVGAGSPLTIIGATAANPCEIQTSAAHGLASGQHAKIAGIVGTIGTDVLNGNTYQITVSAADKFTVVAACVGKVYTSGGTAEWYTPDTVLGLDTAADSPTWTAQVTVTDATTLKANWIAWILDGQRLAEAAIATVALKEREG